jgi:hypothetical protein
MECREQTIKWEAGQRHTRNDCTKHQDNHYKRAVTHVIWIHCWLMMEVHDSGFCNIPGYHQELILKEFANVLQNAHIIPYMKSDGGENRFAALPRRYLG